MKGIAFKKLTPEANLRIRFFAIIFVVIASITGMLFLGKLGMDTLTAVRAYVGGESNYSKGQQGAAFNLLHYAHTHDEKYYHEYLKHIRIPLGDKAARLALEKVNPDVKVASQGFKQGGIHSKDIDGMINLFLKYRNFEYIDRAIQIWALGDQGIQEMVALGEELHRLIQLGDPAADKIVELRDRLALLNHELHELEEEFSNTMGDASRWVKGLFVKLLFGFATVTAIVCFVALWFVGKLISNMQIYAGKLEAQNWLKSGQTTLNEKMRDEQHISGMLSAAINQICEHLCAGVGAIYVYQDDNTLLMMAGYALERPKGRNNRFRLGEGLVGQVALGKKQILITNCPDDYISINSGLGAAKPLNILVYPLVNHDLIKGVVEIGSFRDFSDEDINYLHVVSETIAVAITATQSRHKEAELLKKTQQQAEKLNAQQEELRQSNEELEEQAKFLKESEQRLQTQQEELRVTNEELTEQAQILEEQKEEIEKNSRELSAAKQAAEEKALELELAGKYKSEFLANMSHELRTPLNGILLLSKLLHENKDGNLTEKQAEFAQTIHSAGSDLLNLINDVLDLSKVEAGKMDLNISGFTLERLSQKLMGSYKKVCDEKGLQFGIDIHPDTPRIIHTDFQRLEQILINFISNALKFTEAGSIILAISRPASDTLLQLSGLTPDKAIAFAVSDTGIGIKKKMQQLIFKAFQQADGSTSRKFGGTGLGLSISREFAKHLRGEIQLDSEEGKGSTFTLYLPEQLIVRGEGHEKEIEGGTESGESEASTRSQVNAETDQRAQMDAIRDDRRDLSRDDRSILIIEDDPVFLKTLKSLAQDKGFKTLVAGDGETGLHMADYYQPSAIILDVGLPRMDGWKVMTRLKEAPGTRHIPVHFISGAEKPHDAIKMGAVGYLLKPVSMDQLNQAFATIEELIDTQVKRLMLVGGDGAEIVRIKQLLNDEDISIEILAAGNEALRHLRQESYHCIILGLSLSDMTGTELIRQIREDTMISHVPIIVYTDRELTNHERVYLDSHCERVIAKDPKSLERLFDETTLFLHRVEANLPEHKRRILKMVHDKESILKEKKILITDDDMRNVFALTSILEDKGIQVVTAQNGREGVSSVVENPDLDLVLMDIMMPEMNGYEAIRKIREMDDFGRLPIIALTAKAMRGDRAKCIEAGANDYLSKPVDSDKLLSMLRVWLYR